MRTRKEITSSGSSYESLILDVLLDIRELLSTPVVPKPITQPKPKKRIKKEV